MHAFVQVCMCKIEHCPKSCYFAFLKFFLDKEHLDLLKKQSVILLKSVSFHIIFSTIRPFYKARAPVRLTQERPKCALHHGKMSTIKCRARYEITHEYVSNDLKMWIKRLHTEIHNIMTIYIHYKSIYFKIITCIILGLVNSNVFACKTNSAFNDFVDFCVTGKRNRTGARAL